MKVSVAMITLFLLAASTTSWGKSAAEETPIEQRPVFSRTESGTQGVPRAASSGSSWSEAMRVMLALAVVIGVIFFLRWAGRHIFPGAMPAKSSRAVQVLARTMLGPKQSIMLMQVGKRVLVVADSGTQMNSLCQIDSQEEVAELVGKIREEKSDSISKTFGHMFGKTREKFVAEVDKTDVKVEDEETESEPADKPLAEVTEELSGLQQRVKLLGKKFA